MPELPRFCSAWLLFVAVALAELVAVFNWLAMPPPWTWQRLGLISLHLQWIALLSLALLCIGQRGGALPATRAGWIAASLVPVVVAVALTWFVTWVDRSLALGFGAGRGSGGWVLTRTLLMSLLLSAALFRYLLLRQRWLVQQRLHDQARLRSLSARIRPHFLFNSLNMIASLIPSRPEAAEAAVEDLSDLLRGSLRQLPREYPLAEELALCGRYLDLQKLRLGERLRIDWRVTDLPSEVPVPPFCLQVLVENAVVHGIEPDPAGGVVQVIGETLDSGLRFTVTNPCRQSSRPGGGTALKNLRQRLALIHGDRAELSTAVEDRRHVAVLQLPLGGSRHA